jgi:hypothetical protein
MSDAKMRHSVTGGAMAPNPPRAREALQQPLAAFPSWFLRIECGRCGKVMHNEMHAARWRDRTVCSKRVGLP